MLCFFTTVILFFCKSFFSFTYFSFRFSRFTCNLSLSFLFCLLHSFSSSLTSFILSFYVFNLISFLYVFFIFYFIFFVQLFKNIKNTHLIFFYIFIYWVSYFFWKYFLFLKIHLLPTVETWKAIFLSLFFSSIHVTPSLFVSHCHSPKSTMTFFFSPLKITWFQSALISCCVSLLLCPCFFSEQSTYIH